MISEIQDSKSLEVKQDLNSEIQNIKQEVEKFKSEAKEIKTILNNLVDQYSNQKEVNTKIQESLSMSNLIYKDIQYPEDAIKYADFISNTQDQNSVSENNKQRKDVLETSSTRIMSAAKSLEKPLQSLIVSEVEKLQLEIKLLQKERDAYKTILQERVENEPKKITFWQELKNNFSQIATDIKDAMKLHLKEFNQNSERQEYTKGLLKLFHSQNKDNIYEGKNYRITNENGIYTVNAIDDNRKVMQFRSTITGTKIIEYSLNQKDIQALRGLRNHVEKIPHTKQRNIISTSFQEFGKS